MAATAQSEYKSRPRVRWGEQRNFFDRNWDLVALLLLLAATFPAVWVAHNSVTQVPNLGLIDDNWHLDYTFKALRGIWIGRDVAFTHGPLFQKLSAIPAHWLPLSFGALYATWNTVPVWCAFLFAYISIRLLLPEQPPWKRFVFLLLVASFWETSLRSTSPVLLFALFLRGWYEVEAGRLRAVLAGVGGAVLCVIAFLMAGDVGMYSAAGWGICWLAVAVETRRTEARAQLLVGLASFIVAALILAVVVNSFMATPFSFKFWRDSLVQVAEYRWATPAAMTDQGVRHLLGALVFCTAIFVMRWSTRVPQERPVAQRTGFLAGAFLLGLVILQSALVRSDLGHVIIGEFALIFFTGVVLFSLRGTTAGLIGAVIAIAASMVVSQPIFWPSSLVHAYRTVRNPVTRCGPGYGEFQHACYVETLTPRLLTAGGQFLSANSAVKDSVFVFPYQTMYGLAAERNVAGGLMQAYTASGPELSEVEISGLEGKTIPAALYFTDPDYRHSTREDIEHWSRNYLSVPVDGIPSFTRTPEVWFWMLRHYRSAGQLAAGIVGLKRDDARASQIVLQAQPLGIPQRTYQVTDRSSQTGLGSPVLSNGFDFIRLRMTVRYPIGWKLRKPERLQLEITRANGSREMQWFLAKPNQSYEVWFYPWDGPDLANYFNADEAQWRPGARSPITNLRVLATPLDWVSVQPSEIVIESAEGVRVTMGAR
jgi:hypothetical protein